MEGSIVYELLAIFEDDSSSGDLRLRSLSLLTEVRSGTCNGTDFLLTSGSLGVSEISDSSTTSPTYHSMAVLSANA